MTFIPVKISVVAFFIALVKVSDGYIITNFQPVLSGGQYADLKNQLDNIKMQYKDAQTNFDEHQNETTQDTEELKNEISQLQEQISKITNRLVKIDSDGKKRKEQYDLLLQVADDEKLMYDSKLQECNSGKVPKSFGDAPSGGPNTRGHIDPEPKEEETTTQAPLVPGVLGQVVPTQKPTTLKPLTTTPWVGETMAPPLVEGVKDNVEPQPQPQQPSYCQTLVQSIKQSNDTLINMNAGREETIKNLGVITQAITTLSSSIEALTKKKADLMNQKQKWSLLNWIAPNKTRRGQVAKKQHAWSAWKQY